MNINSKGHSGFRSAPALVLQPFRRVVGKMYTPQMFHRADTSQGKTPSLKKHFDLTA